MSGRAVTLRRSGYHQFLVYAIKSLQIISADISKNVCIQYSSGNFHIIIIIIIIIINWFASKSCACKIQKQLLLTPEATLAIFSIKWSTGPLNAGDIFRHSFKRKI